MRYLLLAAGLAVVWPEVGFPETLSVSGSCKGIEIGVTAPEASLLELVCEVAVDHAARLAACGIHQSRPLSISIVPMIEGMPENCVGAFHCSTDEIEIVLPQTLAERDVADRIYRGLAPEAAFTSILRHELTHAFTEHTTEDRPISDAAHEYIAFAFQISAMTDDERSTFLATNGRRPAKSLDTFNMFIYGLLPGQFASAAWLHFSAPGNRCAFVKEIIEGQVVLGGSEPSEP
jgi:hypothetical protein